MKLKVVFIGGWLIGSVWGGLAPVEAAEIPYSVPEPIIGYNFQPENDGIISGENDVVASNIESDIEPGIESDEAESSNTLLYDFSVLLGAGVRNRYFLGDDTNESVPIVAVVFDLEYRNFFFEANRKNRINAVLGRAYAGYHIWADEDSSIDLISGNYITGIETQDKDSQPIPELVNLKKRKDDYNFGVRYSRFKDDLYFSTELVYDVFATSHESWIADTYVGKVLTQGNWDITVGASLILYSSKVTNYHAGVTPEEVAPGISSYHTGSSYTTNFEFSAQYPVSESWVFETGINYNHFSSNIKDSPLIIADHMVVAYLGLEYVF
ncbi:MipA/OmpV family protein [Aliikangiella coralliicola]|uniref:MipA/OmpV family protein n=1 Tax=Aliikangiella coralliicola TaxID=2592383 RepID=A0A545UEU9_9GAMM|nr:MipA/OmpV family protein [Aliikangiella coralliicola]TQV87913.1 MipA/OmpV family protein [Aliikangiella coralliicola]